MARPRKPKSQKKTEALFVRTDQQWMRRLERTLRKLGLEKAAFIRGAADKEIARLAESNPEIARIWELPTGATSQRA